MFALKTPSALPCKHIQRCSDTQGGRQTLHQHTRAPPIWCPALGAPAIMSFPPGARGRLPDVEYQRGVRRSAAREVKSPLGPLCPPFPHSCPCPAACAVYVGNYEYDASERELERTFDKYGDVKNVEYKSGAPGQPCHPLLSPLEVIRASLAAPLRPAADPPRPPPPLERHRCPHLPAVSVVLPCSLPWQPCPAYRTTSTSLPACRRCLRPPVCLTTRPTRKPPVALGFGLSQRRRRRRRHLPRCRRHKRHFFGSSTPAPEYPPLASPPSADRPTCPLSRPTPKPSTPPSPAPPTLRLTTLRLPARLPRPAATLPPSFFPPSRLLLRALQGQEGRRGRNPRPRRVSHRAIATGASHLHLGSHCCAAHRHSTCALPHHCSPPQVSGSCPPLLPCLPPTCRREWGRMRRRLRVEFAKNDANVREREKARRAAADPNRTLFVAGFDPRGVRTRDIEQAFEAYGRLVVSFCCPCCACCACCCCPLLHPRHRGGLRGLRPPRGASCAAAHSAR